MKARVRAERVKEILFRRNISQNCLAAKLNISSSYCSQILSGVRSPSPSLRMRLMHELKEDFDNLFEPVLQQEETKEDSGGN